MWAVFVLTNNNFPIYHVTCTSYIKMDYEGEERFDILSYILLKFGPQTEIIDLTLCNVTI